MRVGALAIAASVLLPLLPVASARAADAPAMLERARRQVESADYRLTGRLVRVDASGARTSENVNIRARWFPGVLRVLFEITSPAAARVHLLLEMRPGGTSTILIAHPGDASASAMPFDKWNEAPLGEALSGEDFLEAQYFWVGQKDLGETKFGARACDLLESTPGAADKTHFSAVKSWLDEQSSFPVYVEKTVKASGIVKEFTYFGLRQSRGVWWASQVEAKIRDRAGSTLLIIERGSPEAKLGLKDFSHTELTHF